MEIYAPDYYLKFKCIADKCRHSCCIGWDVYVDDETLQKYAREGSELGSSIRNALTELEDGTGFKMCQDGRCPFLDDSGLCDIITQKGDDLLCEICREHPRFYNFFSDRIETGIGLSCEEASRIITGAEVPAGLVGVSTVDDEEYELQDIEKYVTYSVYRDEKNVTEDYIIVFEKLGEAADSYVPIRVDKRLLEVTTATDSKVYDGEALQNGAVDITKGSLAPGHRMEASAAGSIHDVGKTENALDTLVIYDEYGNDVTGNYEITVKMGTLTVLEPEA